MNIYKSRVRAKACVWDDMKITLGRVAITDPGEARTSRNCRRGLGRYIGAGERVHWRTIRATGARTISNSRQQGLEGNRQLRKKWEKLNKTFCLNIIIVIKISCMLFQNSFRKIIIYLKVYYIKLMIIFLAT